VRENALEERLAALVAKRGGVAVKLRPPPAGLPDRLVLLPWGRTVFIELKSESGRVSPAQSMWHARLIRLGYQVVTISSPVELDRLARRW